MLISKALLNGVAETAPFLVFSKFEPDFQARPFKTVAKPLYLSDTLNERGLPPMSGENGLLLAVATVLEGVEAGPVRFLRTELSLYVRQLLREMTTNLWQILEKQVNNRVEILSPGPCHEGLQSDFMNL